MTTEWMRKHIDPKIVARYEREMQKLRGEQSSSGHIVENLKKMNEESERIETESEFRDRALAEDAEEERLYQQRIKKNK